MQRHDVPYLIITFQLAQIIACMAFKFCDGIRGK